ncbi:hypothetical protein FRC02_011595 [Tulasnella sp. 418]|nr:hypothetical protein FRC02_011595 [Tulasnella sp. 418]
MQSITPFTPIKKNCRTKHSLDVNRLYYSPEPNKSRRILDQVDESSPIQQRLPTKKTRSPLRPSSHAAFRDNDVWSTLPKRKKLAVKEKRKKSFVETGRLKMPLDRLVQAQGSPSPCRRFSYRPPPKQSLKGTADEGGWKLVRGPGNIADYSNTWGFL